MNVWIYLAVSCSVLVNVEAALQWPSCSQVTATKDVFMKDNGKLFKHPNCNKNRIAQSLPVFGDYNVSYVLRDMCETACCEVEMSGTKVDTIMGTFAEAMHYYIRNNKATGLLPKPFLTFDGAKNQFEPAVWDPKNQDKFKFKVIYRSHLPYFLYQGNVPEGKDRMYAPYWNKNVYMKPSEFSLRLFLDNDLHETGTFSKCSCGYYDAIYIRHDPDNCHGELPYSNCLDGHTGEELCQDIDECAEETHNCALTPHSHCVNTIGSFNCECDANYFLLGGKCVGIGIPIVSQAKPTSTSAQIFIKSRDLPASNWSYSYNVTDVSNPTYPLPVYKSTQIKVSQAVAKAGVHIMNLNPGTDYSVTWDVYDANNTLVTDIYDFSSGSVFKTLCTCGEATDAPLLLGSETITQDNGFIYFKFLGNSMCGDAYTFARQTYNKDGSLTKPTVFTPNYFYTGAECSPVPYEPGKAAADNLASSQLQVGEKYKYSIRAVGNKYLGDSSSMDYVVHWEASISGFVGLKPAYGGRAVEGVIVTWSLYDDSGATVQSGQVESSASGRFKIHPKALVSFKNDKDYKIKLAFRKQTVTQQSRFDHEFLCINGSVNCTESGVDVYVKHLDFDVPVNVIDATSVPVTGKVYVANTKFNSDGTMWGSEGCPVANAKVCLIDRSPQGFQSELMCTETASDGKYILPAVIGSRVSVNVTYDNHTFQYVPGTASHSMLNGVEISPNIIYEYNDFADTTVVPVELTVAGGACDLHLGEAEISYQINGCQWGGNVLKQPGLRQTYMIPAQNMVFSVDSIAKRSGIQFTKQNLDLQKSLLSTGEYAKAVEQPSEDTVNVTQLRFQYDGTAQLSVVFQGDMNDDCKSMTPEISGPKIDSLHVLPFQRPTTAIIFIKRDLGAGLVCDAVDATSQLMIHNNLGLNPDDSSDNAYAAAVAASMPHETLELLYHCSKGCLANVTQDYDPILKRNAGARVEFHFMTGRPNNLEPFVKRLMVRTQETNSVEYNAAVVITGQYKKGELYSVALPTYDPIMIIRDPPGGTSYTFYENVQTTVRIENHEDIEYKGMEQNVGGHAGVDMGAGSCTGLGFSLCSDVLKIKALATFKFSESSSTIEHLRSKIFTGGFTTKWSYKTSSSNPIFTGNLSDTYVVPNLNMKFSMIDTVSWNQSSCSASVAEDTAYNLQSPENVPALTFVTGAEIVWTEIPALQLNIQSVMSKMDEATTDYERKKLQNDLDAFQDALQGWQNALALNEELKQQAIHGDASEQVKPHQWFEKVASKAFFNETNDISTEGMSHNSALLSDDWMARAKLRSFYQDAQGSLTDLQSINTIKFAGGGSEFSYVLTASKTHEHLTNLGNSTKSTDKQVLGTQGEGVFSGIALGGGFDFQWEHVDNKQNIRTDDETSSTSIGFAFSDPDAGDLFDVDVFIDPVFGTFVFNTRSGKSGCKHEPGTESRQEVEIELVSMPPAVVLEDEPMVFHYRITRTGMGSGSYMLQQELREDVDGLVHYPFLPREYPVLEYGQSFVGTLELKRGPEKYEYPAYTLFIQPSCEYGSQVFLGEEATIAKIELYNYIDPVDQSKKIKFARPCAPVVLQGDIAKDEKFMITSTNPDAPVNVVVQNPEASLMTWADAMKDDQARLKRVQLFYRPLGSTRWSIGQHLVNDKLVDIDFALAGVEDAYGFAAIGWEVSHLLDGSYEMQVRTVCDDMRDAPAIFNGQETEVILGVIDRKAPKLYGLPQPQVEMPIGQPVTFTFDEPLDCSLPLKFGVDLRVDGIDRVFNNDNLMVICEDRVISVQFDSGDINVNDLVGKHLSMMLTGVVDANRNLITKPVSYSVDIVEAGNGLASRLRRLGGGLQQDIALQELEQSQEALKREIFEEMQEMREMQRALADEIKEAIQTVGTPQRLR